MLTEREYLEIPVDSRTCNIRLVVYPQSSKAKVFEESEPYAGESRFQLLEGCVYAYELINEQKDKIYQFEAQNEIVKFHPNKLHHANMGTFVTGIYVGSLTLEVCDVDNSEKVIWGKVPDLDSAKPCK